MLFDHISDNHGHLPTLHKEAEFVISTGDFMPNEFRTDFDGKDSEFQENWLKTNLPVIKEWLDGRNLLILSGNHDRFNPAEILGEISLDNKFVEFRGNLLYGYPGIPYIKGEWNHERSNDQLYDDMIEISKAFSGRKTPDILCVHAPAYGILDGAPLNKSYGNQFLSNAMNYEWNELPKFLLCGHCHEANGQLDFMGVKFSNAATKVHLLEI